MRQVVALGRMRRMTTLEHRVRGLQTRLAELEGGRDEKLDQLTSEVAELRKDVKTILELLKKQAGSES
jgi:hypothetical protein